MVPLRQVAEIVETTSPQIIKRQELQRRVALYANVEGRPSGDANKDVQKIIKEIDAAAGLPVRRRRAGEGHGGIVPGGARCAWASP